MKSNQELLKDYKKSNKVRRTVIIAKAGFTTEQKYLDFLNGVNQEPELKTSKKKSKKKKAKEAIPTIHNVFILDASGSMGGGKLENAIEGINKEIKTLQAEKNVFYTQTIVDFSGSGDINRHYFMQPISLIQKYDCSSRGMTALYEAVGDTLTRLRDSVPLGEKVLVKIFTDGAENDSRGPWRNPTSLQPFINELEKRGFTITFVGTNADVAHITRMLKIDLSNTLTHDNTAEGMGSTFAFATASTITYAKKVLKKEDVTRGFYKKIK
jgi:uncharacterized protein YegL